MICFHPAAIVRMNAAEQGLEIERIVRPDAVERLEARRRDEAVAAAIPLERDGAAQLLSAPEPRVRLGRVGRAPPALGDVDDNADDALLAGEPVAAALPAQPAHGAVRASDSERGLEIAGCAGRQGGRPQRGGVRRVDGGENLLDQNLSLIRQEPEPSRRRIGEEYVVRWVPGPQAHLAGRQDVAKQSIGLKRAEPGRVAIDSRQFRHAAAARRGQGRSLSSADTC